MIQSTLSAINTLCSNTFQQVNSPSGQSLLSPESCMEGKHMLFSMRKPTSKKMIQLLIQSLKKKWLATGQARLTYKKRGTFILVICSRMLSRDVRWKKENLRLSKRENLHGCKNYRQLLQVKSSGDSDKCSQLVPPLESRETMTRKGQTSLSKQRPPYLEIKVAGPFFPRK